MAVEDKYVDSSLASGKITKAVNAQGQVEVTLIATEEIAAADDDGSVYRFFKSIPSNYIPVEITVACDAITNGTDYDLGLYKVGVGGAVVSVNCLMNAQTLASALTRATGYQLGLAAVNIANINSTLGTISGQTDVDAAYDIALTGQTVGTAAGTVTIIAKFLQG